MTQPNEPKEQLETTRGGSGRKGKTGIGAGGDNGDTYNFDPEFSGSDEPPFEGTPRKLITCDRSELIRNGWQAMLHPAFEVILDTANGKAALDQIAHLQPDLILLDIDLIDVSGLELCNQLAQKFPIIVASDSYHLTKLFHQLMRTGVIAMVLKSSGPATLFEAIRLGTRGTLYVDHKITPLINQNPAGAKADLTDSERDVLIRLDLRNKDIADELDLQLQNVEKSLEKLLTKLKTPTRTAAALSAVQMGFILLPKMPDRDQTGKSAEEIAAERHARNAINSRRDNND